MSTFEDDGTIDPERGVIVLCVGKKGSGKSIMGLLFFRAYPGDKVVIDVAGDDGPTGADVITIVGKGWWESAPGGKRKYNPGDLPTDWPEHLRKYDDRGHPLPMILRYVPDPRSDTYLEDMDHIVGLVMQHGNCAVLVHEIQALAPAGRTPPNMRLLLMHNRHQKVTGIFCGPRSQTVDVLCINQADLIYTFELQGAADRVRIAENIGWEVQDFHRRVRAQGPHEHQLYDANVPKPEHEGADDPRLVHMEALPIDVVESVKKWADGYRPKQKTVIER